MLRRPSAPAGVAGLGEGRPARGWSVRLVTAGVRLVAVALTVIMAQWALLVGLDLVAYQWAVRIRELPPWTLGLGVLVAGLVIELVLGVTRLRLRRGVSLRESGAQLTDPVGYAWLTSDQHVLWGSPQTIALQRHVHHGVALGSIALVAVAMVGGWVPMPEPWVTLAGWVSGVAIVLGVGVLVQHSLSAGTAGDAGWGWLASASRATSALGLGVAVWSGRRMLGVVTGLILLGVATVAVLQVPGDELTRQLRPAAMTIGLLTPAGFVLGKGISALRSRSDRRTIAILWDVGTFLPRWFDPLSPPSYGDNVVTDLQDLITEELAISAPDGERRTLLLAPHSQGTVIAAAAVLGLPPKVDVDRLALLTYGSPLRHLYAEFFPRLFDHTVFVELHARLGGRWRNLARTSDPIGAPVGIDGVDVLLTDDSCGRGHSAYPREAAYDAAVADLQHGLGAVLHIPEAEGISTTASATPSTVGHDSPSISLEAQGDR